MAPANVANVALLREASQHVEVMNVTGRNSKLPSELGGKGLILFLQTAVLLLLLLLLSKFFSIMEIAKGHCLQCPTALVDKPPS